MGIPGFTATVTLYKSRLSYFSYVGFVVCGGVGQRCCRPPSSTISDLGPVVSCDRGLGCDIAAGICVSSCGGPGQVCCDGPETRATKWTAGGLLYSPASPLMLEMCRQGACDRQSHRCFTCGIQDGAPCCPPDAAQATARCMSTNLECEYDPGLYESGTCRACGTTGKPPCHWGCDDGLGLVQGLCHVCGGDLQPKCDDTGCKPGLHLAQGLCRHCGGAGQIPCDYGCNAGLKLKHGLCALCGADGQQLCDSGCNPGTIPVNGVCRECGKEFEPPCGTYCNYPMRVVGGVCRLCGERGQIPCADGCHSNLVVSNGLCQRPSDPESCSPVGGPCVPDTQPGTHCCQHPGAPELCVYQVCKACIPHGEEVPPGGTQVCCSYADTVVLDQFSGKAVCGIPG